MRIVIGRGNRREVYDLPAGSVVAKGESSEVQTFLANVRSLLGFN